VWSSASTTPIEPEIDMTFRVNGQVFQTVWAARKVHEGATLEGSCMWSVSYYPEPTTDPETGEVYYYDDPFPLVRDCGAEVVSTRRGWECAAGHSHVWAEVREAEGWEYAEDDDEAARMIKAGVEPRDIVTGGAYR
jgi:hypothetical protein